jgi:SET domain-containing protein
MTRSTASTKPAIYVRKVRGMGRGVFAGKPFRKGETIEVCPVILLPRRQERKCVGEILEKYIFHWPKDGHVAAIALGYGSMYNHSPKPNAKFAPRFGTGDVVFKAARAIEVGEQIFIDYEWEEADYDFPAEGTSKQLVER